MGLAAFQAKRYSLAGQDFEHALAEQRHPLTAEQREEVEHLKDEANALTARFRLVGQVPGAVIRSDSEPPRMDSGGFLVLEEGTHKLSLTPSSGSERAMTIEAEAGTWSVLDVGAMRVRPDTTKANPWKDGQAPAAPLARASLQPDLEPDPVADARVAARQQPVAAAPARVAPPRQRTYSQPHTYEASQPRHATKSGGSGVKTAFTAAAIGGAAIATGFSIWQWRIREDEVDRWNSPECLAAGKSRRENCGAHERRYEDAQRLMWITAGAAVALAGTSVALLVIGGGGDAREESTALRCLPGPLTVRCGGSF